MNRARIKLAGKGLMLLVWLLALSACNSPALSSTKGRIAFVSENVSANILIMNADGSNLANLTDAIATDYSIGPTWSPLQSNRPTWSPDGTRLAFVSNVAGGFDHIYVISVDNRAMNRLTRNADRESSLAWLPDGSKIAYFCETRGVAGMCVVNSDGSDQKRLTDLGGSPSWSPDSTRIVFDALINNHSDIYVVNADGSGRTQLTQTQVDEEDVRWSPDGKRIAYRVLGKASSNIWVMNSDGTQQKQLTDSLTRVLGPEWSPDSLKLAFAAWQDGDDWNIFIINADGTDLKRLTTQGTNMHPQWSPDGTRIAFSAERVGSTGIYVMNADGSAQTRLTDPSIPASSPVWSPKD